MFNSVLFSEGSDFSTVHADYFLSKYRDLFKWKDREDMLEAGCSIGKVAKRVLYPFVKDHLNRLIAVDIDGSAIEAAKEANDIANVSFERMDIADGSDCDRYKDRFGHVFTFYVLHAIHRSDLWSRNLAKMLRPGGQLFASIVQRPNFLAACRTAQKEDKSKPWSKYIEDLPEYFFDYGPKPVEAIGGILEEAGFAIDSINCETLTFEYDDLKSVREVFAGGNNFLTHIPEDLREAYMDDFMERTLEFLEIDGGTCRYQRNVVSFLATKV